MVVRSKAKLILSKVLVTRLIRRLNTVDRWKRQNRHMVFFTVVFIGEQNEAAAVLSPWFANLMNALSNQVQTAVCEIAAVTLADERNRLLDEFRFQIQNEAIGTIEHVIATSKEELARRGLKVLSEGRRP